MIVTIRSLPHVSKQQFHDHWRHPHGTWGRGIANIATYIQNHRISTPLLDPSQNQIDGVVEVGFENAADIAGLSQDHAYLEHLKPDEPTFVENTGIGFLDEDVLYSGPPSSGGRWAWRECEQSVSIKLIQIIRGISLSTWRTDDDLALGHAIGALRHVISTPNPKLHADGEGSDIIGTRQLWWPTYSDFEQGVARNEAVWRELTQQNENIYTGLFQAERFI